MARTLVRTTAFAFIAAAAVTLSGCASIPGLGDALGGSGGGAENAESIASAVAAVADQHGDEVFMVELPSEASGSVTDIVVTMLESGAAEDYAAPSGEHYGTQTAFPVGSLSAAGFPYDALITMRDQDLTCDGDAAPTVRAWITAGGSTVAEADCGTGGIDGEIIAQEIDGMPVPELTAPGTAETLDALFAEVAQAMGDETPVSMLYSTMFDPAGTFDFEFAERPGPDGSSCAPVLSRGATLDPTSNISGLNTPHCGGVPESNTPLDATLFNSEAMLAGMQYAVEQFNAAGYEGIPPMSLDDISGLTFTSQDGALYMTVTGANQGQISSALVRP